jgi:heterodisulfide reductase subunit C
MSIPDHYRREKQRYIEGCTRCGLCAHGCPILPRTDAAAIPPRDNQKSVFDGVTIGESNPQAHTKAFACMECFKCTVGICPEDLSPMIVNEIIKGTTIAQGAASSRIDDARATDSAHRVLARLQVSSADYARITTAGDDNAPKTNPLLNEIREEN